MEGNIHRFQGLGLDFLWGLLLRLPQRQMPFHPPPNSSSPLFLAPNPLPQFRKITLMHIYRCKSTLVLGRDLVSALVWQAKCPLWGLGHLDIHGEWVAGQYHRTKPPRRPSTPSADHQERHLQREGLGHQPAGAALPRCCRQLCAPPHRVLEAAASSH